MMRPVWLPWAVLGLSLAGCAAPPPAARAEAPRPEPPASVASREPEPLHAEFERAQRARAMLLEQQGRWSEALLAWEVLAVLEPESTEYPRRRSALGARIETEAADRIERAAAAKKRNDTETATQLYLSALALDPENDAAAQALRAMEKERNKRQHLGKPSRTTLARRANAERAQAARAPAAEPAAKGDRNEIEHAAMLLNQGEIDDAVVLLEKRHAADRRDAQTRLLLADAYYRKAESLVTRDLAGAVALLQKSVKLDGAHQRAAARLKLLGEAPAASASTGARPAGQRAALEAPASER